MNTRYDEFDENFDEVAMYEREMELAGCNVRTGRRDYSTVKNTNMRATAVQTTAIAAEDFGVDDSFDDLNGLVY